MAYPGSFAQQRCQCSSRISAGAGEGCGSLEEPAIECWTLGLSRGMNSVTPAIVTLGTIRPEDSGVVQNASFSINLHSETQVLGRLGMSASKSHRHVQNPLSGERRKTL